MSKKYKVALLGYYGFDNLGDELLLTACLESLTRSGLEREKVIVLSNKPDETRENFCVDSANRWSLREVIHALRSSENLVLGGGGLFQDVTSVKSCVYYWGVVRLAYLLGVKIFALGQSIGSLNSRAGRFFAGNALRLCRKIHVRDDESLRLAETLGCKNVVKGTDIVMTLAGDSDSLKHGENVLVNLRPCSQLEKFVKIITPYVNNNFVGAALSSEDESALKLLPVNKIIRVKNFAQARELWSHASCAIGMRLHFGVLSRIFKTPLALMPYDVKVSEFAAQSGVPLILDSWLEPVKPRDIPEGLRAELDSLTREIIS